MRRAAIIAGVYLVLSGLWVSASDALLQLYFPEFFAFASPFKGWLFVLVTASFLLMIDAITVAVPYLAVAMLWIGLSDTLLMGLFPDDFAMLSLIKGWIFVSLTSLLLFFLVRRQDLAHKAETP